MKVMYKDGITRHVSDATAVRLKASGYVEKKAEKAPKKKPPENGKVEE